MSTLESQIGEILNCYGMYCSYSVIDGAMPQDIELLTKTQATQSILKLITEARIRELKLTLIMNGVHSGDWKCAIEDRLKELGERN